MAVNVARRRAIRVLEARRDKLTESVQKARTELVKVRAELKNAKRSK